MANKETKLSIIIEARNKAEQALGAVANDLDAVSKSNANIIKSMKTIGAVGAGAFAGISAFVGFAVKSAGAAQVALATMDATLKAMGKTADGAKEKILEYSKSVVRLGFDDEAAAVSVTKLFQVTGDLNKAMNLNNIAMDLARSKNMELADASRLITMVLSGNARALKEYGIELDETKTPMEALTQLQGMLAGQAEGFATTLPGQLQVVSESFDNLKQAVGDRFAPALQSILDMLTPLIEKTTLWIEKNPELTKWLIIAAAAISLLMAVMYPLAVILPQLATAYGVLTVAIQGVTLAGTIAAAKFLALVGVLALGAVGIYDVATHWQDAWDIITIAVAESANFIQSLVEAISNSIISMINVVVRSINSLLSSLASIPKIGSQFKKLQMKELDPIKFERYDTGTIYNEMMNRPSTPTKTGTVLNFMGNTFLDKDSAEKIGDLIMKQLQFSNSL